MCMALNISKPPVLCKYSIAILLRLISRRGHYSVQPKKEKKKQKKKEKAYDFWAQGLHPKQPALGFCTEIKAH